MLLEGKKVLVTGVLTDDSIAFSVAKVAQEAGAEIVLTSFGRATRLTERIARRLDPVPDVLEMDVNQDDQIAAVAADLEHRWGRLDGLLHAIGFAPQDAMGGDFLATPWESVATAFQTSAYSLKALTAGMRPLLKVSGADGGASVVTLT
ncbi:MAG TPA: SDR family oxidoreductase, partial [Candidatus Limnocylindria bacterium]|nr:SDR family oxidoreductase [Candidatus Limnocylindria bacterium]